MQKAIFFLLVLLIPISGAFSQKSPDYSHADAVARQAPDSCGYSVSSLSAYFNASLPGTRDRIRAFYVWTTTNIVYDVDNMFTFRSTDDPAKTISHTLHERKAVCAGYAELFHELCENAGIESYVIPGYTWQNGQVVTINHAWVVARVDTGWYFFDPTWGSGVLINGKFTKRFSNEFYMVKPTVFIRTHMPFDPMWQCLVCPLTPVNFLRGVMPGRDTCTRFSWPDSIEAYEKLPKGEKVTAALRRLEKNGISNNALFEYQRYLQQSAEIDRMNRENEMQNRDVALFNEAADHYNKACLLFNEYIDYWNHQFRPARPEPQIRKMIDTCNNQLAESRSLLGRISTHEQSILRNKEMLLNSIRQNQERVDEQSNFLSRYFSTPKAMRSSLFRKFP